MTHTPDIDVFGDAPNGAQSEIYQDPRIWARFLAKWIDLGLNTFPFFILMMGIGVVYAVYTDFTGGYFDETVFEGFGFMVVAFVIHIALFILLEAFCISVFGNTPGKALMGIRVAYEYGGKLPFPASLKRSFIAATVGLGLGIPIVALVTHIMQSRALSEDGYVFWDKHEGVSYKTAPVASWRWAGALIAFFLLRAMDVALNYVL